MPIEQTLAQSTCLPSGRPGAAPNGLCSEPKRYLFQRCFRIAGLALEQPKPNPPMCGQVADARCHVHPKQQISSHSEPVPSPICLIAPNKESMAMIRWPLVGHSYSGPKWTAVGTAALESVLKHNRKPGWEHMS